MRDLQEIVRVNKVATKINADNFKRLRREEKAVQKRLSHHRV